MPISWGWKPLSRFSKLVGLVASVSLLLILGQGIPLFSQPIAITPTTPTVVQDQPSSSPSATETLPAAKEPAEVTPRPKYAFATIITGEGDTESDVKDAYFTAARLLTYQLLYSPQTKPRRGHIPFLVLVTKDVPQAQRDTLTREGATVILAENLEREWIHPKWSRWTNVLAKLNLWKATDYEKIAFLDADTIVLEPLDDIFEDSSTALQPLLPPREGVSSNLSQALPETYLLSGLHDRWVEEALPPVPGKEFYAAGNYVNAGFLVLSPSQTLFDYYVSLLDTPDRFDASYPEQNLLNLAHRADGRMPWQELGTGWNHKPLSATTDDLKNFKSLHQKWWRPVSDPDVNVFMRNITQEMEGFFNADMGAFQ
ncbi:nucleotide-diphospho-sugar transferase [Aspergillus avenaceus]|uniref:Nucleotide-diphospho-sugar transferase n=1 Tax=Aspergillus avenaceus TaxID=36643 RepID=A0A5N6U2D4_ASPAV|nr:nucleotide-diphospho-sugar transferase [Aspergillus avenaceus]